MGKNKNAPAVLSFPFFIDPEERQKQRRKFEKGE